MGDTLPNIESTDGGNESAKALRLDRLTYEELAKVLRVRPCTVRSWQMKGLPYVPCGRLKFYDLAAVQAWLRERDEAKRQAKQRQQAAA